LLEFSMISTFSRSVRTFALVALASLPAFAANYTVDGAHSRVGFGVKHMMVTTVKGDFKKFSGTVVIDDADLTKSTVKVEIETASVDTGVGKRDEHLKSAEFFDVAKFPKMTFASTSVAKAGDKLSIAGDLMLHGVTKPVTLTVEGPSKEWTNPWGQVVRGASATTKINRKDFGLSWGPVTEAGAVVVGDEVSIELELELTKVVEAPKAAERPAEKKDEKPAKK
jgi:polyisoprenoid-binding protein YceI